MEIVSLINEYGFPITAAAGMGYLIYYIWIWVTKEVKPLLGELEDLVISLADRVRVLDNDLIRLHQKVDTVLQLKSKLIERERLLKELEKNKDKQV
jgi:hypothetical protein